MTQIKSFSGVDLQDVVTEANEWLEENKYTVTIKQVIQNDSAEWTVISIVYEVE